MLLGRTLRRNWFGRSRSGIGGDRGWWWGRQRSAEGSPGGWEGGWVASRAPALGPSDFFRGQKKNYKSEQPKT